MRMEENIVDYLLDLLKTKGADIQYGNEDVTQLEHALQCAELAEKHKLPGPTIAAALLHDVGHLIYEDGDPIHEGKDGHHENLGADFLKKYFGDYQLEHMLTQKDIYQVLKKVIMIVYQKHRNFR